MKSRVKYLLHSIVNGSRSLPVRVGLRSDGVGDW
jgi:hypothetical protein